MTVEFAKGFMRACAAAGMDAETVIKQAQQLRQPTVDSYRAGVNLEREAGRGFSTPQARMNHIADQVQDWGTLDQQMQRVQQAADQIKARGGDTQYHEQLMRTLAERGRMLDRRGPVAATPAPAAKAAPAAPAAPAAAAAVKTVAQGGTARDPVTGYIRPEILAQMRKRDTAVANQPLQDSAQLIGGNTATHQRYVNRINAMGAGELEGAMKHVDAMERGAGGANPADFAAMRALLKARGQALNPQQVGTPAAVAPAPVPAPLPQAPAAAPKPQAPAPAPSTPTITGAASATPQGPVAAPAPAAPAPQAPAPAATPKPQVPAPAPTPKPQAPAAKPVQSVAGINPMAASMAPQSIPKAPAPKPLANKFLPPVRQYGQDLNTFDNQLSQWQKNNPWTRMGTGIANAGRSFATGIRDLRRPGESSYAQTQRIRGYGMKTSSMKGIQVMQPTVKSASVKSIMTFIKSMLSGAGNHVAELAGTAAGVSPHSGSLAGRFKAPFTTGKRLLQGAHSSGVGVGNALRMNPRLVGEALGSTAVAATPAALVTSALMDKNSAFLEGFQLKCAELNLDPVRLYKQALDIPGFGPIKGRSVDLSWVPGYKSYANYNKTLGNGPVTGEGFGTDMAERLHRYVKGLGMPAAGENSWRGGAHTRELMSLQEQARMQATQNRKTRELTDAKTQLANLKQVEKDTLNPPKSTPYAPTLTDTMKAMNGGDIAWWARRYSAPASQPLLNPELLKRVLAPAAPAPVVPPALQPQVAKNVASATPVASPVIEKALPPGVA